MRRRGVLVGAVVGAVLVGVAGTAAALHAREQPAPPRPGPALTTPVLRQTLVDAVTVDGQLSYGPETPVTSRASGTLTWLPDAGTVVDRGGVLFRADERPVVLLLGLVPMYRSLSVGVSGGDVRQLEENLQALGYDGFTVDETFTAATGVAVRRWQHDLGVPVTGSVEIPDVIYAPTAVRVASATGRLGGSATGDVLSVTGVARAVTLTMPRPTAGWARAGLPVTVISGPNRTPGVVATLGSGSDATTVVATVTVADQGALTDADPTVEYVARQREDVLTVPVAALLALDVGGYGLQLADGRIVPVQVGMFADGRVEVSGTDIAEGVLVGIPA